MHPLAALRVVDRAQLDERAGFDTGFFARLTASRVLERLAFVNETLGNAPRRFAVVVARGMHEQDFELSVVPAIEQSSGGLFHAEVVISAGVLQGFTMRMGPKRECCAAKRVWKSRAAGPFSKSANTVGPHELWPT